MNVERKIERGRPKKRWLDTIEKDTRTIGMCVGDEKIENSGGLGQGWPIRNN
jgi:hypothetical protein